MKHLDRASKRENDKYIVRPGADGTEIQLRMDYHYPPVKIQPIDKKGDSAEEQVTTEIRYE